MWSYAESVLELVWNMYSGRAPCFYPPWNPGFIWAGKNILSQRGSSRYMLSVWTWCDYTCGTSSWSHCPIEEISMVNWLFLLSLWSLSVDIISLLMTSGEFLVLVGGLLRLPYTWYWSSALTGVLVYGDMSLDLESFRWYILKYLGGWVVVCGGLVFWWPQ